MQLEELEEEQSRSEGVGLAVQQQEKGKEARLEGLRVRSPRPGL